MGQAVSDALRKAAAEHAAQCVWYEVSEGDAVIVVHDDASALIKVALRMSEDLFEAPGHPQLRIAVDYGPVWIDEGSEGRQVVLGGEPLRRGARIEPHVGTGEIWATDDFRQVLEERPSRYQATPIPPRDEPRGPEGAINVKKPGSSEPDIWLRLYRIGP